MHSHIRLGFIMATAAASLMSSAALAQTAQPSAGLPATTVTATSWMTQEAAGQWRTSKMIGLNVFNNSNEKIGAISELIVDRSGKLQAAVVGAGGFLGLGERDVAVPFDQIDWVSQPVASTSTTPTTTGAASNNRTEAVIDNASARSYPDHAVLNMTKEQLKAAPEFKFSR
jgi:sporulation protein YlmC with PRC-barrel domain